MILLAPTSVSAQNIYGYVYDTTTDTPLPGATVYINGTTIGTITDLDGRFLISTDREIKASLIVSYVGYTTQAINNAYRSEVIEVILTPSTDMLEEVVVTHDGWSREKKLREFKKQFLGATRAGELCTILNEDDIDLWFQEENETLKAASDVPIRIRNNLLGYEIEYNLNDFEAKYDQSKKKVPLCRYVYYDGWSFYKDFTSNDVVLERFKKSRVEEYKGSVMHFLRSLVTDKLKDEGFALYNGASSISRKRVFDIFPRQDRHIVVFKRNFLLEYKKNNEMSLITKKNHKTPLIVFPNGNYVPPKDLRFDGYLALERVGNTLPTNYDPGL